MVPQQSRSKKWHFYETNQNFIEAFGHINPQTIDDKGDIF
jgi:hypothetical protein